MAADAITRVGQWLRSTVPGDLARVVGTGDGVATDDVAAVLDALDAAQRSAATERAQREAAEGECARLRAAIKTQAAAARTLDAGRVARTEYEERVLRSVAGQDRAAVLAQVDEARAEAATWNARATAMESDRDAAVAQREALAGAVRAYDAALAEYETAREQPVTIASARSWVAGCERAKAKVAATGAALDALLTEEVGDGR